jgi:L-fuculose-phosphate aldolase
MPLTEKEHRQNIVEIGRLVYQKGWVAANDGNISIRLDDRRILATPTGVSKGMMSVDDLIVCDMEGNKIEGKRERTSEILMHTTVYAMRPDVHAVVHTHPPIATGFAVAGRPLNMAMLPEVVVGLGCVPLAEYGLPGTPALSDTLRPYIPTYDALMMSNHGVVCYADEVYRAFYKMETVEHFARIALVAELLGGPRVLPRKEVDKLFDARTRYGVKSKAMQAPGCPVVAEDLEADGDKFLLTRAELIALVDEAVRARS